MGYDLAGPFRAGAEIGGQGATCGPTGPRNAAWWTGSGPADGVAATRADCKSLSESWLGGQGSNLNFLLQRQACCRLHHPPGRVRAEVSELSVGLHFPQSTRAVARSATLPIRSSSVYRPSVSRGESSTRKAYSSADTIATRSSESTPSMLSGVSGSRSCGRTPSGRATSSLARRSTRAREGSVPAPFPAV